jgi:predicted glycogen debranching enzyme
MSSSPTRGAVVVDLRRDVLRDLDAGMRREWLVTNGLGGYASGTAAGVPTRAYHGYLIAALNPPVDRTVLVSGLRERVAGVDLHALEHVDGRIEGGGAERLVALELEGMLPVWTWDLGDGRRVERRVWMKHRASTTYVRYELLDGAAAELELGPLVTRRDHQKVERPLGDPLVEEVADGARCRFGDGPWTWLRAAGARFEPDARWAGPFALREQAARGEGDDAEAFAPGTLRLRLELGRPLTLVLSTDDDASLDGEAALARARERQAELLSRAGASGASPLVRQLVLAADQFLVERQIPVEGGVVERGRTVIAGYHWFNDWGRDTMIALPGLTLATGRADEGAAILRSFARFVRDGLLPNNFPDHEGEEVGYHTIDASLWYPVAIERHRVATGDETLVDDLLPVVRDILDAHVAGTRYGIGMDPSDALIRGSAEGYQLTWMDAKVEDWVVTPRRGKPVEIQALWVNALRIAGSWLRARGKEEAAGRYEDVADRASASFRARFWRPELGYLADVVDGPEGDETKLRPNQVFAVALPHPLVDDNVAASVVDAVTRELLTPGGLRSLAPSDPDYRPKFMGDRWFRDAGYHQGTVWSWLIGPYIDALVRLGRRDEALAALRPFEAHLSDGGLGTISENFEPTPPFEPRGCIAQAWGVAEVLRCRRALTGE